MIERPTDWNESNYLASNPDVMQAVSQGRFSSGFEHYLKYGKREGRLLHIQRSSSSGFHYIDDYRSLVKGLLKEFPREEAMSKAVGGHFDKYGEIQRALLIHYGLENAHSLIDVGCGSGRLAKALSSYLDQGTYVGFDVVQELLDYAKEISNPTWTFFCQERISIPCMPSSSDFVCFFSVFTHLLHEESYQYLVEAKRVLKDGGKIVFSFLEFREHWSVFEAAINCVKHGAKPVHLNTFIDIDSIKCWAQKLELDVIATWHGSDCFIPIPDTDSTVADKATKSKLASLGQSVCILQKSVRR